jgi:hypothetical protein
MANAGGNNVERSDQMPFDGIETYGTVQLAKLGAVERLLATEQQWCKGRLRDAQGRHCLVGAIEGVEGRQMLQRVILHAAREVSSKRYWRIEFFNDDPHTTHADVLAVLQRARQNIINGMIYDPQPWHRRWARALPTFVRRVSNTGAPSCSGDLGPWRSIGEPPVLHCSSHTYADTDREEPKARSAVLELQD